VSGPMFPEVVMGWYRWRFRRKLREMVRDLGKAGDTLETYRPLSELSQALEAPQLESPPIPQQRERS
jgi:hypothetical protein